MMNDILLASQSDEKVWKVFSFLFIIYHILSFVTYHTSITPNSLTFDIPFSLFFIYHIVEQLIEWFLFLFYL